MTLAQIGTLWVGPHLTWLEQLCLKSFADQGHEITLFTYGDVANVPDGVRVADARDILPDDKILRHARTGSPAFHSDIFRLHMLQKTAMVWADTDAYCLKPWEVPESGYYFGWLKARRPSLATGVLCLPKTSRTLAALVDFLSDEYPIPPWLNRRKRRELKELKAKGEPMHVSLMPWGVTGPQPFGYYLKKTGEIEHALAPNVLYPIAYGFTRMLVDPVHRERAERNLQEETVSIHFYGKRFRTLMARFKGIPPVGSLAADLLERHGIDPRPTAQMFQPAH